MGFGIDMGFTMNGIGIKGWLFIDGLPYGGFQKWGIPKMDAFFMENRI